MFSTFRFFPVSAVVLVTELGALVTFVPFSGFSSMTGVGVEGRESVAETFPLLVVESPAMDPTRFPPAGVPLLAPDEAFFADLLQFNETTLCSVFTYLLRK